jgi:hypothetical protein
MAKPITLRSAIGLPLSSSTAPGVDPVPTPFWAPPKGMDTTSRLSQVANDHGALIKNVRLRDSTMLSRPGTVPVGGVATSGIVSAITFITSDETAYVIRFCTNKVELWNTTDWQDLPVPGGLHGSGTDQFAYTAFNDNLIFSNGVDGMYEYNPKTGAIAKIAGAPPAKHLTTFTGRVIASGVTDGITFRGNRIQWSVKNNSNDWAGFGSGFEDLLSTPGGHVDLARGVHPASDYAAIVLRDNSVWQMSETGDPEAPFRFSRIHPNLGTHSYHAAADVPGGVIAFMNDDVYLISEQSAQAIGTKIRRSLLAEPNPELSVGAYDHAEREYALLTGNRVWRYNMRGDGGWTQDEYPIQLGWISYTARGREVLTIDSSPGTIDAAGSQSIDSELGDFKAGGMLLSSVDRVYEEDEDAVDDNGVNSTLDLQTGLILSASPLEETTVPEIQIEYESDLDQILTFQYRNIELDRNRVLVPASLNWLTYESGVQISTTGGSPQTLSVNKTVVGKNLQFKVFSSTLGKFRLLAMIPMLIVSQNAARARG